MNHPLKISAVFFVLTTSSLLAHTGQDHQNLRHWEIASADPGCPRLLPPFTPHVYSRLLPVSGKLTLQMNLARFDTHRPGMCGQYFY